MREQGNGGASSDRGNDAEVSRLGAEVTEAENYVRHRNELRQLLPVIERAQTVKESLDRRQKELSEVQAPPVEVLEELERLEAERSSWPRSSRAPCCMST